MLEKTALKLFGDIVTPYLGYFDPLKTSLRKANMDCTLQEYLSLMLLYSLMVFAATAIVSSALITMLLMQTIYSYTLGIILSMIAAGVTFFSGHYYPSMKTKGLESKINRSLPFAVSYMATSASSGMRPIDIFKVTAQRGGAVGVEANRIYNNVKSLGMSLTEAMQRTAIRSPSTQFSDLLWGMASVISSGGDIESYLRNRTRTFMSQYRRLLDEYAKQIDFYTEIYITLVIVGSLFFIVLTAILSPMTGGNVLLLQTFLVFFFMPMVSIGFIVLLKGISPSE